MKDKKLSCQNLNEFFYHSLKQAQAEEGVELNPFVEFYVMNLLSRLTTPSIWQTMTEQEVCSLAELYLQSLGCVPVKQADILRQVGDWCLFVSGFFPDSVARQLVDESYYINLGRASYSRLTVPPLPYFLNLDQDVFVHLCGQFIPIVNLLARISEQAQMQAATDILRIYERWLARGREKDKKILEQAGIPLTADFNAYEH